MMSCAIEQTSIMNKAAENEVIAERISSNPLDTAQERKETVEVPNQPRVFSYHPVLGPMGKVVDQVPMNMNVDDTAMCPCTGKGYDKNGLLQHFKSSKHQRYLITRNNHAMRHVMFNKTGGGSCKAIKSQYPDYKPSIDSEGNLFDLIPSSTEESPKMWRCGCNNKVFKVSALGQHFGGKKHRRWLEQLKKTNIRDRQRDSRPKLVLKEPDDAPAAPRPSSRMLRLKWAGNDGGIVQPNWKAWEDFESNRVAAVAGNPVTVMDEESLLEVEYYLQWAKIQLQRDIMLVNEMKGMITSQNA